MYKKKKVSSIISEFLHTARIGEYFIYLEQVNAPDSLLSLYMYNMIWRNRKICVYVCACVGGGGEGTGVSLQCAYALIFTWP